MGRLWVGLLLCLPWCAHGLAVAAPQKQFSFDLDDNGVAWVLGNPFALLGLDTTGQDYLMDTVFPNVDAFASTELLFNFHHTSRVRLPSQIARLCRLSVVVVNGMLGAIPTEIGALERLVVLRISGQISSIPSQLGQASALELLYVRSDATQRLSFPSELARLSNLRALALIKARFEAAMPPELLRGLTKLRQLFVQFDSFGGSLPSEIGLLRLHHLDVGGSPRLSSKLPSELGKLGPDLQELWAPACNFSGPFPSQVALLTNLNVLWVGMNSLTGTLASEFGNLRSVVIFRAEDNLLSGSIPSELGLLAACTSMYLGMNQLSGTVPSELGQLGVLKGVTLDFNDLEGTLPSQLGTIAPLEWLEIGNNPKLSGTLPSQLGLLGRLLGLGLEGCRFHGALPTQLALLSSLSHLHVSHNRLGSSLPVHLAALTSLVSLDVGWNQLAGTIPPQLVAALSMLTDVRLEHNSFDGVLAIPEEGANGDQGDDAGAVWLANCEESGLWRSQCKLHCAACGPGEWRVRDCRDWEQVPACMPVFAPCLVVLGGVVGVVWVVRRFGGSAAPTKKKEWAVVVALSTYHMVDLLTDVLFAVAAPGVVGTLSYAVLGVVTAATLVGSLWILLRAHFDSPLAGWIAVVVATTLYPGTLARITTSKHLQKPIALLLMFLSLSEASLQGVLQAYSALTGSATHVVLFALGLSALTVLSKVAVFVVMSLSRVDDQRRVALAGVQLSSASIRFLSKPAATPTRGIGHDSAALQLAVVESPVQDADEEADGTERRSGVPSTAPSRVAPVASRGQKREGWRRRVVAILFCGALLALLASTTPATDQASTQRVADRETASQNTAPRHGQSPRVPSGVQRPSVAGSVPTLFKADCPPSLASFNESIVSVFNAPVGLISLAPSNTDFGQTLTTLASTLVVVALYEPRAPVPTEIGLATGCRVMFLWQALGTVPSQIGLLQSLEQLFLESWDAGTLPSQIGLLTKLTYFETQYCVRGPLPSQIGLLRLHTLRAWGALWRLPSQLASVATLTTLDFARTSAWGDILDHVQRDIVAIDLESNAFSTTIPSTLGLCPRLQSLRLNDNSFSGTIPSELGQLAALTALDLGDNLMSGALPSELGQLSNLAYLVLASNGFSGTVPQQLALLTRLTRLATSDNQLHGALHSQLALLTGLLAVEFDGNALRGRVPSEFGQLAEIGNLTLSDNLLVGEVPSQLGLLSALTALWLASNELLGSLPSQLGNLVRLVSLRIDHNRLSGTLPPQLARLTALTEVTIGANRLSGHFPVRGAMLATWTAHCDLSGLESGAQCARECPSCGQLGIVVRDCDARGFNGTCGPWYVLVPALVLVFAAMWLMVKRSSGNSDLTQRRRGLLAAGSTLAVLVWVALLAFVGATAGAIRTLAIAALSFHVLMTSLVTTAELSHEYRTSPTAAFRSYTKLVQAFLHCVVDPFIVLELSRTGVRRRTVVVVLCTVVASHVPMVVLESVELRRLHDENGPTSVTTLALVLTSLLLVSCARVFANI